MKTELTEFCLNLKETKLSLSSLFLTGVVFYTCMSLLYLHLAVCKVLKRMWPPWELLGPRMQGYILTGLSSHPSPLHFRGPQMSSSTWNMVGFLQFSSLFLRLCCGCSCQSSTAAIVAPRALTQSEDVQNIIMQLYCLISSWVFFSDVGFSLCCHSWFEKLVFFVQRQHKN